MNFIALKMLLGDRPKYAGLLFGITFTAFLVTFAASYFAGLMTRSFALIAENPLADIWVMDPAAVAVSETVNLPDAALNRVRSVAGVRSAVPLALAQTEVRFPNGRFQSVQIIGVDDATLTGSPRPIGGGSADILRFPGAVIADAGGTTGKLDSPTRRADQWPWRTPHLAVPMRELASGDELLVNDTRVQIVGRSESLPRYPPRPVFFTTLSQALRMLPWERRRITFVLASVAPGFSPRAVAEQIAKTTGLRARTAEDFKEDTVRWMLENSEDVGDVITMLSIAMLVGFGVTGVMMFMFTNQNLKFYAVLNAMGTGARSLLAMVMVQSAVCGAIGAGLGLGLCALGGRIFEQYNFPFRMMWFAPAVGVVAVILICVCAAAFSIRPVLRMQPTTFLAGR